MTCHPSAIKLWGSDWTLKDIQVVENVSAEVSVKRKRVRLYNKGETLAGYLFLAPNIIGFLTFTAFPVLASLILSFFSWELLRPPVFVGLQNFKNLFLNDANFITVVKNTIYYVGVYVPVNIILALILAVWLCSITKGVTIFRTALFMPVLVPTVAAAFLWKYLLHPEIGIINLALKFFGVTGPSWLGNPDTAMMGIIMMSVWKQVGYNMVIFIAGIKSIPAHLYEAAKIDGANSWQRFLHITLPMISPALFFGIVMTVITSFQVFDQAYIMTAGGPANATNTIVMYIYQNGFQFFKMGYAASIAWLLFGVIFTMTMIQMRLQKEWVNYE